MMADGLPPPAVRFHRVTLEPLLKLGCNHFAWIHPGEQVALGSEKWTPSTEGAFLYLMASGNPIYFPAQLQPVKASKASVRV